MKQYVNEIRYFIGLMRNESIKTSYLERLNALVQRAELGEDVEEEFKQTLFEVRKWGAR